MILQIFSLLFCSTIAIGQTYNFHLSESWYPARGKFLQQYLDEMQKKTQHEFPCHIPDVCALIVPHAAYEYSGTVATSAYQNLKKNKFKRVIILAPAHFATFQGAAVPGHEYEEYKSPLGIIKLDVRALRSLVKNHELFQHNQRAHEQDHAIEMQIPLIQQYCGMPELLPILISQCDQYIMQKIAHALVPFWDSQTAIIISSDFIHYGSQFNYVPFLDHIAQKIADLDTQIVERIQKQDVLGLQLLIDRTRATVCGIHPIEIFLMMLREKSAKLYSYVTGYAHSSKDQENPEHNVSYVGMVWSTKQRSDLPLHEQLTGYEKKLLLKFARKTILNLFTPDRDIQVPDILTNGVRSHVGAFVTLYNNNHELRGCIGRLQSEQPLYKTVIDVTRDAALHDTRFEPVHSGEVKQLDLEISVLTKMQPITSYKNIRIGVDGVVLESGNRSAVFLPQVAVEQGWNLHQMLSELSQKAGVSKDAFAQQDTKFKVFQALRISK